MSTLTPAQRSRRLVLASMSEAEWQAAVCQEADRLGVNWYHPNQSIRDRAGYPDLTLWGPGGVAFAELKKVGGKLRPEQARVRGQLLDAGAQVYLWRPGDMDEVTAVLTRLSTAGGAA